MAKDILFSEEYVEGKERKLKDKELDEMAESISKDSFKEPKYEKEGGLFDVEKKREERKPVDTPFGKDTSGEKWEAPKEGTIKGYRSELEDVEYKQSVPMYAGTVDISEKQAAEIRAEREAKWKAQNKLPGENIIQGTYRKVTSNPLDVIAGAKGYASESKMKLEASTYGITPAEFEQKKAAGKLWEVKAWIDDRKKRALQQKKEEAYVKRIIGETRAVEATAAKREQQVAQAEIPKGGNKIVYFGSKNFGQSPIPVNAAGSHGDIRSRYLPGQQTGVATSLANSRLAMAQLRERAVPRGSSGVSIPSALMPNQQPQYMAGVPNTVVKLSANAGSRSVSKLGNFSHPTPGPTILQRLSAIRKRF